ncbi:MAG: TrmJ/YjtD family RNA methyltransferase [Candidatus Norongarragalinales archaeon]
MVMQLRVVLVEPKWDVNVGSICRAMKNFGASELYLVKPKAELGVEAIKFAKHAREILEKATKVKTMRQAFEGCTLVVGTTGILRRFRKKMLKKCVSAREVKKFFGKNDKVALVFGNEEHGLSDKFLGECDVVAFIPSNPRYPVLNLSHAVAVMLYELYAAKGEKQLKEIPAAPRHKLERLEKLFFEFALRNKTIRDPKKVATAFKRVLRRARPSEKEIQALFPAF